MTQAAVTLITIWIVPGSMAASAAASGAVTSGVLEAAAPADSGSAGFTSP